MKPALRTSVSIVTALLLFICALHLSLADPTGASISFNSTGNTSTPSPHNRTDLGGTINFINLDTTQQDSAWKAYVGNVSGLLTLDDYSGNTIYNWALASVSGEVYASRANNVTWSAINCSLQANVDAEQEAMSFTSTDSDSINRTFNNNTHRSFLTATRNMTGCRSKPLFVNDTAQTATEGALFQEILLSDNANNLVYTTIIEVNSPEGFDRQTRHFQLIVPQSKITSIPTLYYFYVELG